jgi:thiol:disulfide interchange protein DsbD
MIAALFRLFLIALVSALAVTGESDAASEVRADHVTLSLALEQAPRADATVWVAIQQSIDPGWHTYWRNPGDSGLATSVAWSLPAGVTPGEIAWPAPERFVTGSIVNFGYAGRAVMLVPLALGHAGGLAPAHATLSLLECAQMCIPERITLGLPQTAAHGSATLFADARAAIPRGLHGAMQFAIFPQRVRLTLRDPALARLDLAGAQFIPATPDIVNYDAPAEFTRAGDTLVWSAPRAALDRPAKTFAGVLELPGAGAFAVSAVPAPIAVPRLSGQMSAIAQAAFFAFLGGLILNLMPCVLPVLSMKALAMVRAGETPHDMHRDGIFYFLGVLATFAAIAGALLGLKSAGAALGWGFQLQYPPVVLALALLMAAIGLNLLGAFELPLSLAGLGEGLVRGGGGKGAFFTGALAVLVASPCTAPFMGTALGYALTQTGGIAVLVFLALGSGFALPFTALALSPHFARHVPRPGAWMVRFRELLAFPMFATSIWLFWVLGQQSGTTAMAVGLLVLLGFGFLLWLWPQMKPLLRAGAVLSALAMFVAAGLALRPVEAATVWSPWSQAAVAEAREAGRGVLVDFSAAWCVTCLVNERVALADDAVVARLRRDDIATFRADWTNRSADIATELARYGRGGVPLYLFFPAHAHRGPVVLPQLLTPAMVLSALNSTEAPDLRR